MLGHCAWSHCFLISSSINILRTFKSSLFPKRSLHFLYAGLILDVVVEFVHPQFVSRFLRFPSEHKHHYSGCSFFSSLWQYLSFKIRFTLEFSGVQEIRERAHASETNERVITPCQGSRRIHQIEPGLAPREGQYYMCQHCKVKLSSMFETSFHL